MSRSSSLLIYDICYLARSSHIDGYRHCLRKIDVTELLEGVHYTLASLLSAMYDVASNLLCTINDTTNAVCNAISQIVKKSPSLRLLDGLFPEGCMSKVQIVSPGDFRPLGNLSIQEGGERSCILTNGRYSEQ